MYKYNFVNKNLDLQKAKETEKESSLLPVKYKVNAFF